MRFTSDNISNGVLEQSFTMDDIPAVLWSPVETTGGRPLVLLGHGGGQHKQAPGMVGRAHRYVSRGFAVAAIDAPGHGDRPKDAILERLVAEIRERVAQGEPLGPHIAHYNVVMAERAVPEWQTTLDALLELEHVNGRVGYWGVSMGCALGIPLLEVERRISAAVLGLAGHDSLIEAARKITIPVEFLLQWDDEMVPREAGLALFDALASPDKTLHANPGSHMGVPGFELESSERFFARHLLAKDHAEELARLQ